MMCRGRTHFPLAVDRHCWSLRVPQGACAALVSTLDVTIMRVPVVPDPAVSVLPEHVLHCCTT
jgi:hypothetical protein